MKTFFEELMHADSITEVLADHRKETVKLAAGLVVVLLMVLLYLHQGSAPLQVSDDETGADGIRQERLLEGEAGAGDAAGGADSEDAGDGEAGSNGAVYDTDGIVYVDIGGAVKQPMLAELPVGSRVEDAIQAAGGLKKNADMSGVNRAQILTDGEKVYIPEEGESVSAGAGSTSGAADTPAMVGLSEGRININTADVTLLQQLTGVGPVTAQKIVDYREQNGKFQAVEDLKKVSGIGDKTFEKMKDDVTI